MIFAVYVMDYGSFYRIINLKSDGTALRRLLQSHEGELEIPARRLFEVIMTSGCRSVVVEKEYVDADFRDSHKSFHYLHYKDTSRRCIRLHFFTAAITEDDLRLLAGTISETYLGYAVVRPLPSHTLGCTILNENVLHRMFPRSYPGESRYLGCSSLQQVNIAGNKIIFRGVPWMQQDKLVAACASVAIWIANRHLAEKFPHDFKRTTTAEITKLATRNHPTHGRGMPSDGLSAEQMLKALNSLGYEPLFLESQTHEDAAQVCSQYIRSSVPVIAILDYREGSHAVTLVGHTVAAAPVQQRDQTVVGTTSVTNYKFSDFIPRFIAQDDSGGPLRSLEFMSWDDAFARKYVSTDDRERYEGWLHTVVRMTPSTTKGEEIAFLSSLIIPLPLRVTLKAKQAHKNATEVVMSEMVMQDKLRESALVFDTYLRPSNDYKFWWSPLDSRPVEVAPLVRRHMLPHSIWITEVSTLNSLQHGSDTIGHIVQDSSGRGTRHHLDDLILVIGHRHVAVVLPNGSMITSVRDTSTPICKFREGETI